MIDEHRLGIGGYKEVIFNITGKAVYGDMKYEMGVHRVQRVPETEKAGRIHTSTASVAVLPEIEETELKIDPKDLRIDTFCAGGAWRTVGQYHLLGRAHNAHTNQHRGAKPRRTLATAKQRKKQ